VILLAALLLALAACGGSTGGSETTQTRAPTGTTGIPAASEGRAVFSDNCSGCHTLKAAGSTGNVGPDLDDLKPGEATVKNQVIHGGGGMPAFKGKLSPAQITAVASYVSKSAGQ